MPSAFSASASALAPVGCPTGRSTSIQVAAGVHAAASARREVSAALLAEPVSVELTADVELLVSELVTNVVVHANARLIDIEVSVDADRAVTVSVTGGVGEPCAALVHPAGRPDPSSPDGRGLVILDGLASAWGTRRSNGTTTVWFTITGGPSMAGPGRLVPTAETAAWLTPTATASGSARADAGRSGQAARPA